MSIIGPPHISTFMDMYKMIQLEKILKRWGSLVLFLGFYWLDPFPSVGLTDLLFKIATQAIRNRLVTWREKSNRLVTGFRIGHEMRRASWWHRQVAKGMRTGCARELRPRSGSKLQAQTKLMSKPRRENLNTHSPTQDETVNLYVHYKAV